MSFLTLIVFVVNYRSIRFLNPLDSNPVRYKRAGYTGLGSGQVYKVKSSDIEEGTDVYHCKLKPEALKIARYFSQKTGVPGNVTIERVKYSGDLGMIEGHKTFKNIEQIPINTREELFISTTVWMGFTDCLYSKGLDYNDVLTELILRYLSEQDKEDVNNIEKA